MKPLIGTAGWNIPAAQKHYFPVEGSHLQRYSSVFNAVEINSCFYQEHKAETYRRWSETVPENFRFSLKLLKYFTHEKGLTDSGDRLRSVIDSHFHLGTKWESLLIQLPPKLAFDQKIAIRFFQRLRKMYHGPCFIEPRHTSWSTALSLLTLQEFEMDKVLADPEP